MQDYCERITVQEGPRLPLEGSLDLTYRCNNACRHCWVSLPADSPEEKKELTFDEITRIVDEARALGCRKWALSGGEPMLRPDFAEIFDYVTVKSASYSLNTNGTLITPPIARLMKRKGAKMVALYGASASVHDHITRTPGSFEMLMQGFAYLKEEGAGFIVQIVPMKDNYGQLDDMTRLAESLSPTWRWGATWLHLSASGAPERNRDILKQRLDARQLLELDRPDLFPERSGKNEDGSGCCRPQPDSGLFASCIAGRRYFHVNPYGRMSFCSFLDDPAFRYDLRTGTFQQGWDTVIPSLSAKGLGGKEYDECCRSCTFRGDCLWCPAYAYLEHRRYSAKVRDLCSLANARRDFKQRWERDHLRFYHIAGLTIKVESDLPVKEATFRPGIRAFETTGPGKDTLTLKHCFSLPKISKAELGQEVYRKPPWAIYRRGTSWIYLGISPDPQDKELQVLAVFNDDHTHAMIYHGEDQKDAYARGNLHSLTLFPTDQIMLARVLADRGGCYFHSAGVILENRGLLFVGHSGAGKSTIATMLKGKAQILCDDRIIVRDHPEGFRMYGTWSHGDVPEVSPGSAPLKAVLFLEKAATTTLIPVEEKKDRFKRLVGCVIKPLVTREWWEKTLSLVEKIAGTVPCFELRFDRSATLSDSLRTLEVGGK